MGAQDSIPPAANVLGTIGTICWCLQLVPQIWRNYRSKSTEGLPATMLMLWAVSGVPFGVYAIIQNLNIPIQIQAQIFMSLSLAAWAQCLHYGNRWKIYTAFPLGLFILLCFAGIEAALIFTVRPVYRQGEEFPVMIIGIIAAVLIALGLLPPYVEIWKRRGRVIGIDFIFLSIDWLGAFFSLMSLVAQRSFDVIAGSQYLAVLFLETGIFASHTIWLLRTRKKRNLEKMNKHGGDVRGALPSVAAAAAAAPAAVDVDVDVEDAAAAAAIVREKDQPISTL